MTKLQAPILITSCPRSGSGLVAGALELCGAFAGKVTDYSYENIYVRNHVFCGYMKKHFMDWHGQFPLGDPGALSLRTDWREMVENCMLEEGYSGQGAWFLNFSQIALTWPLWTHAFPNARWVIVRRRTGDIIQSCLKTEYMDAFSKQAVQQAVGADNERDGWLWWVNQYEKRFVDMIMSGINVKVVWPQRMVYGDYEQMMELVDWLGLEWNTEVLNFIDPKLWKSRIAEGIL